MCDVPCSIDAASTNNQYPMSIKNFEFKARVDNLSDFESKLLALNPDFRGTDYQTDTYFNVKTGRLKLREGNIENSLISYDREDFAGSRQADIILYSHSSDPSLKSILVKHLGIRAVVRKVRKIYFLGNVKFHFDTVEGLGTFIEAEAIDDSNQYTTDQLKTQCDYYLHFFRLTKEQLVGRSYSDLLESEGYQESQQDNFSE